MSEYIVNFSDFGHDMPPEVAQDNLSGWIEAETFGTPLVRCKDCDHFDEFSLLDFSTPLCALLNRTTDPMYFCAWGKPKEEA